MGYNQENYRRIREEYSRKYLQVQEAASKRREEIHAILPEIKEIDSLLSDMGLRIMQAALQLQCQNLDSCFLHSATISARQ